MLRSYEDWISFYLLIKLSLWQKMLLSRISNQSQSVQSTDIQSDINNLSSSTFISLIYAFSLAGNKIVYTPSKSTKWGKVL